MVSGRTLLLVGKPDVWLTTMEGFAGVTEATVPLVFTESVWIRAPILGITGTNVDFTG